MSSKPQDVHRHLIQRVSAGTPNAPGTASLTYYIFEGVLVGTIGEHIVHVSAWSGGAGGSTRESTVEGHIVNNPYQYGRKTTSATVRGRKTHVHGGPIPPGAYVICPPSNHVHLGLSCFLRPLHRLANDRGGFFIHRQGPHGSDGCIVPESKSFDDLMKRLNESGGGRLIVMQAMDGAFV